MSAQKIGVLYSRGHHFAAAVRRLRAAHPDARLTALVPPAYPVPVAVHAAADEVEETGRARASGLVRQVRGHRFDVFAVMFESPRLEILAALSGARERVCCTEDGRIVPLRRSVAAVVAAEALGRLRGRLVYAALWVAVRVTRVGRPGKARG